MDVEPTEAVPKEVVPEEAEPAEAVPAEDSFTQRRQLFKNIWETAVQFDEKAEPEVATKHKVIKTLRVDEKEKHEKFFGNRKNEQRTKNLRAICRSILDYCDRQDEDDILYEQIAGNHEPERTEIKAKKGGKKKIRRCASTASGRRIELMLRKARRKQLRFMRNAAIRRDLLANCLPPIGGESKLDNPSNEPSSTRRKISKKRRNKKKSASEPIVKHGAYTGTSKKLKAAKGHTVLTRVKELLNVTKVLITQPVNIRFQPVPQIETSSKTMNQN